MLLVRFLLVVAILTFGASEAFADVVFRTGVFPNGAPRGPGTPDTSMTVTPGGSPQTGSPIVVNPVKDLGPADDWFRPGPKGARWVSPFAFVEGSEAVTADPGPYTYAFDFTMPSEGTLEGATVSFSFFADNRVDSITLESFSAPDDITIFGNGTQSTRGEASELIADLAFDVFEGAPITVKIQTENTEVATFNPTGLLLSASITVPLPPPPPPIPMPEPASLVLFGTGILALLWHGGRRRRLSV
jgi:hypothetical protein